MTENKGDLISREALKKALSEEIWPNDMSMWLKLLNVIDNAPTGELDEDMCKEFLNAHMLAVIPAETLVALQLGCDRSDRQGRWKEFIMPLPLSDGHYKLGVICSECNTTWDCSTNYCPHCGARMQAGEEE